MAVNGNTEQGVTDQKYIIHIENFEGPLDLLWSLIKKAKIDITEISLAEITEQYLQYLKLMEQLNVNIAMDFIVMASELIYYKSRVLLPGAEIDDEYFVPPLPPELVQKLLEYKKYQQASKTLWDMFEIQSDSYSRVNYPQVDNEDDPVLVEVSLFDLLNAFVKVLDSQETVEDREIVFDEILVSDKIRFITDKLHDRDQIHFSEIFSEKPGRAEIVASFLAILEMAKTGLIKLMQHRTFGDIRVFRRFINEEK